MEGVGVWLEGFEVGLEGVKGREEKGVIRGQQVRGILTEMGGGGGAGGAGERSRVGRGFCRREITLKEREPGFATAEETKEMTNHP